MSAGDLLNLAPLLIVAETAIVLLLMVAVGRHHRSAALVTLLGLAGAFATIPSAAGQGPRQVTSLLVMDSYGLFFIGLFIAAAAAVAAFSFPYLHGREEFPEEFYILLVLSTLGAGILAVSRHFASFFLGLELLTVPLYAMIAYKRGQDRPIEAGVKYLILAGASAAFILFGMALVYAEVGTMEFGDALARLKIGRAMGSGLVAAGLALIVVGVGFKLAVVPFHLWTPDVYEGAPAPVTAFIATVSKGAVFAFLLRFLMQIGVVWPSPLAVALGGIAVASMFVGNLLALLQNNVKRILAYSSIAHLGYLLVALLAGGRRGVEASAYYLAAYFATTLAAFGVVSLMSARVRDADSMEDYRGLYWRRPGLAFVFTASILSLAGIPLTGGFIGKFYLFTAGVEGGLWVPVLALAINSVIGLFYYLRIIVALYEKRGEKEAGARPLLPMGAGLALGLLMLALLWLGVWPGPIQWLIDAAAAGPAG